jgi:hypothetical protein
MTRNELFQRRKDMALLTQQGYTIPKIATKYGISRQAVSQLLQKAARDGQKVVLRKCGPHSNKSYEYRPTFKETGGHSNSCTICSKEFKSKFKATKTCGDKCRRLLLHKSLIKAKGSLGNWSCEVIKLTCYGCGKSFDRTKYRESVAKRSGSKNVYCTQDCYLACIRSKNSTKIANTYKSNFWPSFEEYQKNLEPKG